MTEPGTAINTDREIWRDRPGDFYADSIHVTDTGSIGINCGGKVYAMPVREWHGLADSLATKSAGDVRREAAEKLKADAVWLSIYGRDCSEESDEDLSTIGLRLERIADRLTAYLALTTSTVSP